ncbi:MAG TPA: hypothetical protein VLC73_03680 [Burkholderiales bacterium]|nr:hypothetical protein [Burkholderiales bacterium]
MTRATGKSQHNDERIIRAPSTVIHSDADWTRERGREVASSRAVLFIRHSGKSGMQRGSSRREDLLDVVIKLDHPSDYIAENGAQFILFRRSFDRLRDVIRIGPARQSCSTGL